MEYLIRSHASNYLIIRASSVVGGLGNPHTVFNCFWDPIPRSKPFVIRKNIIRSLIEFL